MLNRTIRLAAFQNPDFYKVQAMRLSIWDKPRIISCTEGGEAGAVLVLSKASRSFSRCGDTDSEVGTFQVWYDYAHSERLCK